MTTKKSDTWLLTSSIAYFAYRVEALPFFRHGEQGIICHFIQKFSLIRYEINENEKGHCILLFGGLQWAQTAIPLLSFKEENKRETWRKYCFVQMRRH